MAALLRNPLTEPGVGRVMLWHGAMTDRCVSSRSGYFVVSKTFYHFYVSCQQLPKTCDPTGPALTEEHTICVMYETFPQQMVWSNIVLMLHLLGGCNRHNS